MKREGETKGNTVNTYPSPAELYSLEQRVRRMRYQEMGRLFRLGALALKAAYVNAVSRFAAKGVRHA